MRAVIGRQAGDLDRERADAAPAADADEDQVADRGCDETGQKDGNERGAEPDPRLEQEHPGDERPPEERGDGGERPRGREDSALALADPPDGGEHEPDRRPERDERPFRAEHGTEGERAESGKRDPRRVRQWGGVDADPVDGLVPAVAGQQRTSPQDECRADERQPEHEVPLW